MKQDTPSLSSKFKLGKLGGFPARKFGGHSLSGKQFGFGMIGWEGSKLQLLVSAVSESIKEVLCQETSRTEPVF
jgi:hypothetical protein